MEVDHVSFSKSGGAGRVASVLQGEQVRLGHDSKLLSIINRDLRRDPFSNPLLTFAAVLDSTVIASGSEDTLISLARSVIPVLPTKKLRDGSLVHLHWIEGVLGPKSIAELLEAGRPVVWTIHDMKPFTGACHHAHDCKRYETDCSGCPQVRSGFQGAVSVALQAKLLRAVHDNLVIVSPSNWLTRKAQSSRIFVSQHVETIPNPLDPVFFDHAKILVTPNLPRLKREDFVICSVATDLSDEAKGVKKLVEVFLEVKKVDGGDSLKLFLIGGGGGKFHAPRSGIYWTGPLDAKGIAGIADRADLLVSLSEAESAGLTVREFGSRSVPSFVLNRGGLAEMVEDNISGLILDDAEALGQGLRHFMSNRGFLKEMGNQAQISSQENRPDRVSKKYLDIYERLTQGPWH